MISTVGCYATGNSRVLLRLTFNSEGLSTSPVRNQEENNEHATWISMADVVTAEEQASTNAVPLVESGAVHECGAVWRVDGTLTVTDEVVYWLLCAKDYNNK